VLAAGELVAAAPVLPKAAGFWLLPPHPAKAVTVARAAAQASTFVAGRMLLVSGRTCESPYVNLPKTGAGAES
jgi:hypothetical protein